MTEHTAVDQTAEEKAPKRTVEESFTLLDEMVKKLEDPAVSLEESFRLYQEGMTILREVSSVIDFYEKKIQILKENGETEEFG